MRQPSRKRKGTRSMISRSLNDPGLRLVGVDDEVVRLRELLGLRDERPLPPGREEGAAAAAQARRVELGDHVVRRHRARLAQRLEAARLLVLADVGDGAAVGVPAKTMLGYSGTAQLLDDPGNVVRLHAQPVAVVDRDHRRPAAAAEALDRAERERAVVRGRAGGRRRARARRPRRPAARRRARTRRSCTPRPASRPTGSR